MCQVRVLRANEDPDSPDRQDGIVGSVNEYETRVL